jgi:hypothetical protein
MMDSPFVSVVETVIEIARHDQQSGDWLCPAEASASGLTSASCYHVKEDVPFQLGKG